MSTDIKREDILKTCPICGSEMKQYITKLKCRNIRCEFTIKINRAPKGRKDR
jgi:hypothetical protein